MHYQMVTGTLFSLFLSLSGRSSTENEIYSTQIGIYSTQIRIYSTEVVLWKLIFVLEQFSKARLQ